ncbi:MAG: hypothetical protein UU47_C0012G0021 [candidate division TM6 bacterium GW2011_GWE2_41_16]|nr:MAG: hypothetical protein UU47_C0012G0021 [candidate division TM6 bacterium GW2011_GWE2_41_16]
MGVSFLDERETMKIYAVSISFLFYGLLSGMEQQRLPVHGTVCSFEHEIQRMCDSAILHRQLVRKNQLGACALAYEQVRCLPILTLKKLMQLSTISSVMSGLIAKACAQGLWIHCDSLFFHRESSGTQLWQNELIAFLTDLSKSVLAQYVHGISIIISEPIVQISDITWIHDVGLNDAMKRFVNLRYCDVQESWGPVEKSFYKPQVQL